MARICKQQYTVTGPDGGRITRESRKWYVEYRDADGRVRRTPGYVDKAATQQLAAELERNAERQRSGLVDRHADHRKRPLAEHVADWHKSLLDKGNTPKHADLLKHRATRVLTGCRFTHWSDLSPSSVTGWLAELGRTEGASVQTRNFYLQAIKQFCRWLVRDGRAAESPLVHLQGQNVKTDRRHDRRALAADELQRLIVAAERGPDRFGMTGPERALLYRLTFGTGLRAAELRSLTVGSFKLDAETPTVTVAAGYSKRRREDTQPLHRGLADDLRAHFANKLPTAPAFRVPPSYDTADMLRADLKAARAAWIDELPTTDTDGRATREQSSFLAASDAKGLVVDFHALRHSFITALAQGGVSPKVAQQLARHSTITLTMDRYTHMLAQDSASALDVLPDLRTGNAAQRATGTDGPTA